MMSIIDKAERRRQFIAQLKAESSYYPEVLVKNRFDGQEELYASTLVRIERNGIWYVVHAVFWIMPNHQVRDFLFTRLMHSVHQIQHLYVVNAEAERFFEEVDKI